MPDLKVCRICLETDRKMYKQSRFQLKTYYEEITGLKVKSTDGLPRYFCYECAVVLHKFHKFKEKCYTAQNALMDLSWRDGLSYESIENLATQLVQIKSSLDIITVSKRVKTFVMTEIDDCPSEPESIKEEEEKVKEIEEQFVSEDEFDHDDFMPSEVDPVEENVKIMKTEDKEHDFKIIIEDDDISTNVININNKCEDNQLIKDDEIKSEYPKKLFEQLTKPLKKKTSKFKSKGKSKKKRKVVNLEEVDFEPDNFAQLYGLKEQNPAFAKKRVKKLDLTHWKKSTLTEEEVMLDLKMKAEDPKYVAAEFKCTDCLKWFREEDILKRHRQRRHDEALGPMVCRFCRMTFKWDCHLRRHLRAHFSKYECLRCDLVCPLETTALLHEDYHNGVIKKCKHCGIEFKHSSTYYTHLRTHRSEYLCTLCGMSFVSPLGLSMHRRIKHVSNQVEIQEDDEDANTFCEKCNIRFETKKAYAEHVFQSALHTEGVEDLDRVDVFMGITKSEPDGADDDDDKPLAKLAQNRFPKRRKRKPKVAHRKPTTCHQCGKHFSTQKACMDHHLAEHRGTSFFPPSDKQICEICGILLAPGSVAMHRNTHTREKVFPCDTCGRQFNTVVSLKRHQVTHTGEKKFPCPLCDKRFTQSNSMKLHYRTYHLKEPYPKRNRYKNPIPSEPMDAQDSSEERECIRKTLPLTRREMHYL